MPASSDLSLEVGVSTYKYKKFDILKLPLTRSFENINIDEDLAQKLVPTEVRPGVAIAVTGNLVVRDNKYTLRPLNTVKTEKGLRTKSKQSIPLEHQRPAHYLFGKLNTNEFVQRLATQGVTDAKVETGANGGYPVQIHLPAEEILIQ